MMTEVTENREKGHDGSPVLLRLSPTPPPAPASLADDIAQMHLPSGGWSQITILIKLRKGEKPHEAQA